MLLVAGLVVHLVRWSVAVRVSSAASSDPIRESLGDLMMFPWQGHVSLVDPYNRSAYSAGRVLRCISTWFTNLRAMSLTTSCGEEGLCVFLNSQNMIMDRQQMHQEFRGTDGIVELTEWYEADKHNPVMDTEVASYSDQPAEYRMACICAGRKTGPFCDRPDPCTVKDFLVIPGHAIDNSLSYSTKPNVQTMEECETYCQNDVLCRSVSWNKRLQRCGLSIHQRESAGNLYEALSSHEYAQKELYESKCQNGGTCAKWIKEPYYRCFCKPKYGGYFCEKKLYQ